MKPYQIKKYLLKKLHPVLKPLSKWYLSRTRVYSLDGIAVQIYPGVFHPALFVSTRVLLNYLRTLVLRERKILELGAGSGLISIYCARQHALVTATDINPVAIENLQTNVRMNHVGVNILKSDLFDSVNAADFDIVIINPPYYPKAVRTTDDLAWYCGENFEYFRKLFSQLSYVDVRNLQVLMILSEDCDLNTIASLADAQSLSLQKVYEEKNSYETNFIFLISPAAKHDHSY